MAAKRGRPPTFSRDDLIAAALRVGPDKLTLQAVAAELGVARNSLYWHVRDRSEAGAIVLAHLIEQGGSSDWTPDRDAPWDEWLTAYARMLRRILTTVGGWVRFTGPQLADSPESLRTMERLLGTMIDTGFSIKDATLALAFIFEIIFANVRATTDWPVNAFLSRLISQVDASDPDDFALIRQTLGVDLSVVADAQFEHDLECALRGIGARAGVAPGLRSGHRRSPLRPAAADGAAADEEE
jgi:AcrR family transcriptional regulator